MKYESHLSVLCILVSLIAVLTVVLPSDEAWADSWAMPTTNTTYAPLGEYRFTVEPAPIDNRLRYFAEEIEAQQSGETVHRPTPIGLLEKSNDAGQWEPVWVGPLRNVVAPVSVLVADDGDHVVTFDNWHSVGHGENVIVIYGSSGELIRSLPLRDLLPQEYIDVLPRSVSSLRWRSGSELDAIRDVLTVDVIVPSGEGDLDSITFSISLVDGVVTAPDEEAWREAKCAVEKRGEALRKAEEERLAFFKDPLLIPNSCNITDWHTYVREAYYRLSPEGAEGSTATKILFPPSHDRHDISVGWLVSAVADEMYYGGNIAIASPCWDESLLPAFEKAFASIPEGSLEETTLYVSTSGSIADEIRQLIEPSGASLVWLDPEQAIPQRPERIPGSPEKEAADAERLENMLQDAAEWLSEF